MALVACQTAKCLGRLAHLADTAQLDGGFLQEKASGIADGLEMTGEHHV